MERKRIFRSGRLDRRFRRDGFVIVPLASIADMQAVRAAYDQFDSGIHTGYYASPQALSADYRTSVDQELRGRLGSALEAFLVDYRALVGAFIVKHADGDTDIPPHQDATCVDEEFHTSIVAWFPITEPSVAAGVLSVLRGSHRFIHGVRPVPPIPAPYDGVREQLIAEMMEPIPVDVGQAVLFDTRLVHGSPPNRSGALRLAGVVHLIPGSATPHHYVGHPDGSIEGYPVDPSYYTMARLGSTPPAEPVVRLQVDQYPPLSIGEIRARHRSATRRWRFPFDARRRISSKESMSTL